MAAGDVLVFSHLHNPTIGGSWSFSNIGNVAICWVSVNDLDVTQPLVGAREQWTSNLTIEGAFSLWDMQFQSDSLTLSPRFNDVLYLNNCQFLVQSGFIIAEGYGLIQAEKSQFGGLSGLNLFRAQWGTVQMVQCRIHPSNVRSTFNYQSDRISVFQLHSFDFHNVTRLVNNNNIGSGWYQLERCKIPAGFTLQAEGASTRVEMVSCDEPGQPGRWRRLLFWPARGTAQTDTGVYRTASGSFEDGIQGSLRIMGNTGNGKEAPFAIGRVSQGLNRDYASQTTVRVHLASDAVLDSEKVKMAVTYADAANPASTLTAASSEPHPVTPVPTALDVGEAWTGVTNTHQVDIPMPAGTDGLVALSVLAYTDDIFYVDYDFSFLP